MLSTLPYPPHVPLFIRSSDGIYGAAGPAMGVLGGLGTAAFVAWPAANRALYFPIRLPWNYPVKRVFLENGGTATGNVDIGLFLPTGAKVFSTGAFAQSGTSAIQYQTVDWLVPAGCYYLGMSLSSGSATTVSMNTSVSIMRQCGCLQQATAHPLPSTMVGAAIATANTFAVFGLTHTASGF